MSDNKFIEESFDRVSSWEKAYIEAERQRKMEEDWWEYEQTRLDKARKPAIIQVITSIEQAKEVKSETQENSKGH